MFSNLLGSVLTRVGKMVAEGVRGKWNSLYSLDSFMDHAKISNGGSYPDDEVEETKSLGRIIPIFIMLILFWTVYTQVSPRGQGQIQNYYQGQVQGGVKVNIRIKVKSRSDQIKIKVTLSTCVIFATGSIQDKGQ